MIELHNVSKRYGHIDALKNVDLCVKEGCVMGLLGQNGAGKTTLLNILTGYLAPTSGEVSLSGFDPLLSPIEAKRVLGYMPEHPPLYDEMTVQEYLCFAARLRGVVKNATLEHVEETMKVTGLIEMRHRLLSNLSKGYRQRVGMAQALCGAPEVLVLDEPTAGLDPKQITEIRELIHSLSKGRTILFSSHVLSEVEQLCDHVTILHQGKVKASLSMYGRESDSVELECKVEGNAGKVLPVLRKIADAQQVTLLHENDDTTTALLVFDKVEMPERRIFAMLSSKGMPMLGLKRREESLEQVFLRTISEE